MDENFTERGRKKRVGEEEKKLDYKKEEVEQRQRERQEERERDRQRQDGRWTRERPKRRMVKVKGHQAKLYSCRSPTK